ncbi:MAG: potassium-transporting ATPase subunit KdpA [Methanomicrobiales archaeon]|nr:potassium-transporting ATPase subunit KdpA [Methanomicrobiales archaeon]
MTSTVRSEKVQSGILRLVRPALVIFALFTLLTGFFYPLLITGIAQLIFPVQANGGLILHDGRLAGSSLIGQSFTSPGYFWGRPSATPAVPYNSVISGGSNLGPTNPALLSAVKARVEALHAADPHNSQPIPVDLVTASGSGLDPDVSIAGAYYQVPRVARERNLPEEAVNSLVMQQVVHRQFGILGEPRVHVLSLNLALDDLSAGRITVSPSPSLPAQPVESAATTILNLRWMDWAQLILFAVILAALVIPVGRFMAKVYRGEPTFLSPVFTPVERWILALSGVNADEEMEWRTFAAALMIFAAPCILVPFTLQLVQKYLPLNPAGLGPVPWDLSLNTAISFATNTNWQAYVPEITVSHLTQMAGLAVQNFLSAAVGMTVLIAFIFALSRRPGSTIGNFWVLLTRSVLILLPMAGVIALLLVSQGVVQTFADPVSVPLLDPFRDSSGYAVTTQTIPLGPAASQVAIKMLGTNGGGFFNANSAHPLENPTPFSNLVEMLSMILLPASLCYTFGNMVGSARRGVALLMAMTLLFLPLVGLAIWSEVGGNPGFVPLGIDQELGHGHPGGSMEGKEVRFGVVQSAFFSILTTSISCGAVNSMHDSFMPLGGFAQMFAMQLGEVVYGGIGSGLYGMLVFVTVAMFIAGLMVGRTPEYLGKKIEPREMKLATIIIILPILLILAGTTLAVMTEAGRAAVFNPGPHGFSEILYAFTSASQNNGSAFAGIMANTLFYTIATAVAMFVGRYAVAVLTLALAGSFAAKKIVPESEGTLRDHSPLFILWLVFVVVVIGALSFLPVLSLGPIAEFLTRGGGGMIHV